MIRIATYNVEWFDRLFDDGGALMPDSRWSGRRDVKRYQQITALNQVFKAMDADVIMVIEAPDTNKRRSGSAALERFAISAGLRTTKALVGLQNNTQQEIALLYDPDVLSVEHNPMGGDADDPFGPRFDTSFRYDLDIDARQEIVTFSKPPLEVKMRTTSGKGLRLIGVHAKSKAPHGARTDQEAMTFSIANRRKQLAQCIWIRSRVQAHLDVGEAIIVLGDFNDGPGLDQFEQMFGSSGVEIVMGEGKDALFDPHVRMALSQPLGARPTSSRFYLHKEDRYLQALLDYIMIPKICAALIRVGISGTLLKTLRAMEILSCEKRC
jgi:hypothetical protein